MRRLLVEAVEQQAVAAPMIKSRDAKDWERKAQHLADLIAHHHGEAARFHSQRLFGKEERHQAQVDRLWAQLKSMMDAPRPKGAIMPKPPKGIR